jgi:hypothetical protein
MQQRRHCLITLPEQEVGAALSRKAKRASCFASKQNRGAAYQWSLYSVSQSTTLDECVLFQ